jgi:hypothetical protein
VHVWYARYRTPDGQQRTRTFARKVDADHFLVEIEASKQRGSLRASPTVAIGLTTGWQLRPTSPHDPQPLRGDHHQAHTAALGTRAAG